MSEEILPLLFFVVVILSLLLGFRVAFTLGGVSILFGMIFLGTDFLSILPMRIFGIMNNYILIAIPLFIFMGLMFEKSGIAEELLETMALLFGKIKGGLAISVLIVGALLGASTGIVGATVVTMGVLTLPVMLKRGCSIEHSTGIIAASGTLGQIIPPSIILVLLGSVLNVPVGDLFMAAVVPGGILVFIYFIRILIISKIKPEVFPAMSSSDLEDFQEGKIGKIIQAFLLPGALVFLVLGSIFAGIASPTEAAGVGAAGSMILALIKRKLNMENLWYVMKKTTTITSMAFMILTGATAFSLVFRELHGDRLLVELIMSADLSLGLFLFIVLLVVFLAGFLIDFIEIIFIIVPIIYPVLVHFNADLLWVGILLAVNLQTSFLTPPFGFALFYLKGVAPEAVKTTDIYRGVIPYVIMQLLVLLLITFFPGIISFLPELLK
ncbi:MAG: TRAP transporter large permease subunit [Ignavibacteriaceae bacterium]|nr:TRAP transporter large permease subunit [Ignavibacteriaceae bacterium]